MAEVVGRADMAEDAVVPPFQTVMPMADITQKGTISFITWTARPSPTPTSG